MAQLFNHTLHQPERYILLFHDKLTYYSQPTSISRYGAVGRHPPRVSHAPVKNDDPHRIVYGWSDRTGCLPAS